ncbi:MAG: hypothetical protein RLZZ293_1319 [Pseudomonadota bacterium]|jgi:hypothetical protein
MLTIQNSSRILWIVFTTILIDMLGVGILIPIFLLLITPLQGEDIRR